MCLESLIDMPDTCLTPAMKSGELASHSYGLNESPVTISRRCSLILALFYYSVNVSILAEGLRTLPAMFQSEN